MIRRLYLSYRTDWLHIAGHYWIIRLNLWMYQALITRYRWQQAINKSLDYPPSPLVADRIAELETDAIRWEFQLRYL